MPIFPVYCIADIPIPVIETFLREAQAGSLKSAPNSAPSLAIITSPSSPPPTVASKPPLSPFTSPFLGQTVEDVSRQLDGSTCFAVLDSRSVEDGTVLLVAPGLNGSVQTVRATFESAQSTLIALEIASLGFGEIQAIASSLGGVLGRGGKEPKRGGPAPRMRLGGN
ncbi:uncharacterized protein F4822DRAFT_428374 [Hypoxylon trugodes]|uniref:uncharacterized protein n=1 Tax=Hypoxylon trugodes TaxID=326681 RepID=UPI0021935AB4|nr:uncharacterized protein F4822DRAFT_428374 [Hypoxylon trugodes]KAI1390028.1 hypothetical protein F4822DRAFT_428374 [Hypoxylon trugodes]